MTKGEELVKAVESGNLQKVKDLVNLGVNIHAKDERALRWAALDGHLDIIKYLVKQGADIHIQYDEAFRWAAYKGHLNIIKYLVKQGANIHINNDQALEWAVKNNRLDVVDYLKNYKELQPKEVFNLKDLNTDGREVCAKCGNKLNMPIGMGNQYNYCPTCED